MYSGISIALCVLSAIIFIFINVKFGGKKGVIAKTCASVMFVLGGAIAIATQTVPYYAYIFLAGLILSLAGDILLGIYEIDIQKPNKLMLNLGMLSFGLAQICYIIGTILHTSQGVDVVFVPVLLASLIGVIVALLIVVNAGTLKIKFGNMLWQSLAYCSLICINLVNALFSIFLVQYTWILFVAVAFFLASDLILSFMYFGDKNTHKMDIANKTTYYLAQITYVVYLFFFIF